MARNTTITSIGVSLIALALASSPAMAQDASAADEAAAESNAGEAAVVIGGTVAAGVVLERAGTLGTNAAHSSSGSVNAPAVMSRQAAGVDQLQQRGDMARQARGARGASSSQMDELLRRGDAARAARGSGVSSNANLDELARRGDAARAVRGSSVGSNANLDELARRGNLAQQARNPMVPRSDNLDDLARRGNAAQQARAGRIGSGANLDDLAQRGNAAQQARAGRIGSGANIDDLARRGNLAQSSRAGLRNAANAAANGPGFERGLARQVGQQDVARLVGRGDAAQVARGRMVNEGQLMRNITSNGGDITDLNRQGRLAQSARSVDRAADAGRVAGRLDSATDAARIGRVAGRVDDVADLARAGRIAGTAGRAGRAAVAGTGVGALVIAAEIAGTEGVRALTGVELQDPISTGAMYGAAIFSDDITLGDVAQMRMQHHAENFRRLGETLSDPSQIGENLRAYGQERGEDIREFGEGVNRFRDNSRDAIGEATGTNLVAPEETAARYGEALTGGNPVRDVGSVMADRAEHHIDNAKSVGSKVGCGIGNLFRSEENDKDC